MKRLLRILLPGVFAVLNLGRAVALPTPTGSEIDAHVRKEVLNELARQLESRYAIESTAKKLAEFVTAKQKSNAYKTIISAPEFAQALTDDLATVAHDKHLRVSYSYTPISKDGPHPPPNDFREQMRKLNGFVPKVEILDGNVGYMRVNGVPPLDAARRAVAAAFAFLHDTDALIIDNRGNGGGDPETVALYVSYLSDGKPYVVNTFHWREGNRVDEFKTTDLGVLSYGAHKPVFLLTSRGTFSGGEELAYDLQVSKRAVIIGEVTGGGANPGGPISLGHDFSVFMPSGQAINPTTGTSWEGKGVVPDVPISPANALAKALALAVDRLTDDALDPRARSALEAISMKLRSIEEARSGQAVRLPDTQLVGTYIPHSEPGPTVTILDKDGHLIQHIDGRPDSTLVFLEGNRYLLEGRPDEFVTSFLATQGQIILLLENPFGAPTVRRKQ